MSRDRMLEKLARAEGNLSRVRENTPADLEKFRSLGIVKDGVYKNLEDGVQNLLDVCALLVKEHDLGVPADERGFTDLLVEAELIASSEKDLLDDLRGLRNRLVHRYGTIDDRIVHARVVDGLDDVEALVASLRALAEQV